MNVLLDNIVFNLQKAGGISVVWKEHIERLLKDKRFSSQYIEYDNCKNNVFRSELCIPESSLIHKKAFAVKYLKHLDYWGKAESSYIFHSSVYRIDHNKNALNVTTVHDFAYERYVKGVPKWINGISKFHTIRKSDAVICISESTKKDLIQFVSGVDENKIFVVYNGVGEDYFQIKPKHYEMNLPFENQSFVLYVGNRHDYKNFAAVLHCCKENRYPLVIAGGEMFSKNEMEEINTKLGVGNYHITGKISNRQLNELYNRAQVLLYPSKFEGFGIPVLEAQRAGCPVVCLALSSIPEVMGDSQFCLADSSFDAISEAVKMIYENLEARDLEVKRGFINSQRFSWDNTYKGVSDVYLKLFQK